MDEADFASVRELEYQRAALDMRRVRAGQHEAPRISGGVRVCRDCEGPIPWARLRIDHRIVRCIDCQIAVERGAP